MYKGKYRSSNRLSKLLISISLVMLLGMTIGGTIAYLTATSTPVVNTFTPSEVKIDIGESFSNGDLVKSNVVVKNTGDTDAYVRAMVVINWKKSNNEVIPAVLGTDYSIDAGSGKWNKGGDGFYYYADILPHGDPDPATENLFDSVTVINEAPAEGYKLHVEIFASAIQATPGAAKAEAWG